MRRTVVGVIAVVTASSVFSLTGLGVASAAMALPASPPAAASGFSVQTEAATLRTLHDAMAAAFQAKDAATMAATSAKLDDELATLGTPQAHTAMAPDAVTMVSKAQQENGQLAQELAALPRGKSASDLPLPGVASLTSLVQGLLATLLALITGLLGGLPVPVPVAVPPLPVTPPTVPVGH